MIRNPRDGLPSSVFQNRYPVNSGIVGSNPTLSANSYNPKYLPAIELWKVRRTDERLVSQGCPFGLGPTLRFDFPASPSLQQRLAAVPNPPNSQRVLARFIGRKAYLWCHPMPRPQASQRDGLSICLGVDLSAPLGIAPRPPSPACASASQLG